ncbi:MAG TPA: hypothetical protein VH352_10795, partial [Pseudonocardiaceae bacterium]|nr:hypothetical protein [Pseudonocardiaceae bacterium]
MRGWLVTRGARGRLLAVLGVIAVALGVYVAVPALAAAATPGFVQQANTHAHNVTTLSVTLPATSTVGDRLVVEVGVWRVDGAITTAVTDSVSDVYVEVTSFTAADGTEMSVWTAPVSSAGTTKPTVKANISAAADVGIAVMDYSGLSTVADATVVDRQAHASGRTSGAATVASGATSATTA